MGESIQGGLVDILILFYNKVDQTIDCINSFLPSGQHIYVLNNGSDEQQLKKLSRYYAGNPQVHILDAGKNLGVSGGRNFLIQHTRAPWLLSVDNDITIEPVQSWLPLFREFTAEHPAAAIIAPQIYNVHERAYSDQLKVKVEHKKVFVEAGKFTVTNCFPGGASFIQRTVFEQYGLFDEGMFVGFEDYEFALRAMLSEKGAFAVYHINTIQLIHDHQYQKSSKDKEAVKERYNEERLTRSYNRMVEKFGIEFDHDWQWWTKKQVLTMTRNRSFYTIMGKVKNARMFSSSQTSKQFGILFLCIYLFIRFIIELKNFSIAWDISIQLHTLMNFINGNGVSVTEYKSGNLVNSLYRYHSSGLALVLSPIQLLTKNVLLSSLILNFIVEVSFAALLFKIYKYLKLTTKQAFLFFTYFAFAISPFSIGWSADLFATVLCLLGVYFVVLSYPRRTIFKLFTGFFLLGASYFIKYSFLPFMAFPIIYFLINDRLQLSSRMRWYLTTCALMVVSFLFFYIANRYFVGSGTTASFSIGEKMYWENLRAVDGFLFHFGVFDQYLNTLLTSFFSLSFRIISLTVTVFLFLLWGFQFFRTVKLKADFTFTSTVAAVGLPIIAFLSILSLIVPPNEAYINWTYLQETRYYSPLIIVFNLFLFFYFLRNSRRVIANILFFSFLVINIAAFRSLLINGKFGDDFFSLNMRQELLLTKLGPTYDPSRTLILYSGTEKFSNDFNILQANGFTLLDEADFRKIENAGVNTVKMIKANDGTVYFNKIN